ncbi:MAG: serine-pyruvate aminotransferase [Thermoleophilia bacterium]
MRKRYLLTPGPTPVPEEVLLAGAERIIHHRSAEYSELFLKVTEGLKYVFQTRNDVLIFGASGTGGMEAAVANVVAPGDPVLIAGNGVFGERWRQLCEIYGADVKFLEYEWGSKVPPEDIGRALEDRDDFAAVFITHAETSTGAVNDIEAVGEILRDHPALLVVDSVSGLGAVELKTDEWGVDIAVSGSQKALMAPPGLAFCSVSENAYRKSEENQSPSFYLSFAHTKKALENERPQMPWTPPVGVMQSMGKALEMLREEGLERVFARHRLLGRASREAVKAMGLELFAGDDPEANAVTSVTVPAGVDGKELTKTLLSRYGVQLAGGQARLAGRIVRIGHCGYFGPFDVIIAISALEMALHSQGFDVTPGSGVAAAERVFLEDMTW